MTFNYPNTPKAELNLAILNYEGAQLSAVYGLADFFNLANRIDADLNLSPVRVTPVIISAHDGVSDLNFDGVIVPPNLSGARPDPMGHDVNYLRALSETSCLICSVCAGAFWLGQAGYLNNRPATTHWALEEEFKDQFPQVHLQAEQVIVDDGDVITAGGVMAWTDLGLHLIERWYGRHVASRAARQLLIDPAGREQRNYRTFMPKLAHGDDKIRSVQRWMEGKVDQDLSIQKLASFAGMSERSFLRRFKNATGHSPHHYVQQLRIEKAKTFLEASGMVVAEIAWKVGYSDLPAFGKAFKAITGLTASEYRRRFRMHGV